MSNTKWTPGPWHAFAMMNTNETCPTCGAAVRVVGDVTKHYEPVQSELDRLAHRLAEDMARITFMRMFREVSDGWVNLKEVRPELQRLDAIRYLYLRGLLERKEGAENLVRIKESQDG